MALTTAAKVQTALGAGSAAYTAAQIAQAVAWADQAIRGYCDRDFEAADYTEWLDSARGAYLDLPNYPLIHVRQVYTGTRNGLKLVNAAAGAVAVGIGVSDGVMTLTVVGGASAGTSELTLSTYATLALLAAAIGALGTGWTVTVEYEWTPKHLKPIQMSGSIANTFYLEVPDGTGITVRPDPDEGRLYCGSGFSVGKQAVFVDYRAGYETIPSDLEMVATKLACDILASAGRDGAMQSEKLGDYSYTLASGQAGRLVGVYSAELAAYRRISIS